MRAKSLAVLALALGCGLVAAIGITQVMAKKSNGPVVPVGETVDIYVAMEEIPFGEAVTPQNVKLEAWPKSKVPADAISKMEDIQERRTKVALFPGEPILNKKLFKLGDTEQGAVALIPKGYRVVAVKVDAVTGGANLIRPGNRVDVLVNLRVNPDIGIKETCTKMLLQDIKVFAVNDVATLERKKGGTEETIPAATISLLLVPEQAQKVALATQLGTIQLSLRSPDDEETPLAQDVSVQALFGPSEGGDREAESLVPETKDSGESALFAALEQMQAKNAPEPAATVAAPAEPGASVPPGETWQMRIISGDSVDMKLLERELADPSVKGTRMWRVSSAGMEPPAEPDLIDPATSDADPSLQDSGSGSNPDEKTSDVSDLLNGSEEESTEK